MKIRKTDEIKKVNKKYFPKRNFLIATMVAISCLATGCSVSVSGPETRTSNTKTVNGETTGHAKLQTANKGCAEFAIDGKHIKMTNFEFDADSDGKVTAEIEEEDLVYSYVSLRSEDDELYLTVCDGLYTEKFSPGKAKEQLNALYQSLTGADDKPISKDDIISDDDTTSALIDTRNGQILFITENGSNKYACISWYESDRHASGVIQAAYDAFGGESPYYTLLEEVPEPEDASRTVSGDSTLKPVEDVDSDDTESLDSMELSLTH